MSTTKKIHVAIVLDKSDSMAGTATHTISGFNEQVSQIRLNAQNAIFETTATLITFNGDVYEHLLMAPVEQLEEADPSFYQCAGMTAMFDAIGYTIKKIREVAGPDDDVIVVTVSDGDENCSNHYTAAALNEQITGLQATGHWTFTFMGCTAASLQKVNRDTGIPVSNMAVWANSSAGAAKRAMSGTSQALGEHLRSKSTTLHDAKVSNFYSASDGAYKDYTASADGTETNLAEAVALAGKGVVHPSTRSFGAHNPIGGLTNRGSRSYEHLFQTVGPVNGHDPAPVVDRPQDLELRVGTSKVFATSNKASW